MKKIYLLATAFSLLFIIHSNAQMLGSGTPSDPYQVTTCAELQQLQNNLSAYYVLMNDIDCSQTQTGGGPWGSSGFTPIGTDTLNSFTGNFNGHCYAIKNLYINNPTLMYVGIFGFTDAAKVANVNVINATVIGGTCTGIVIGYKHSSTLDTCFVSGYVNGQDLTGGIVGKCDNYQGPNTQITNSFSKAVVVGHNYVGGVVGQITTYQGGWSLLQNCYALCDVTGNNFVGGLSGNSATYEGGEPEIYNCYAAGNVSGMNNVGGLSGWVGPVQGGGSVVQRSWATGNVSGNDNVGGLIGNNGPTSGGGAVIYTSYATGNVSGTDNVGGLVGSQTSSGINNGVDTSYSVGLVTGTTNVGGLIGREMSTPEYDTCFWDSTINPTLQSIGNLGSYSSIYPRTTPQMQLQATYYAWDFTKTWQISTGNYPTFIPLNTSGNCHFPTTLEAAFNYSTFPACVTDSVHFFDMSTNNPTGWSWDFRDPSSSQNTSALQNPAHLFSSTGTFSVTLIVTDGSSFDTIITPIIVTNCTTNIQNINYAANMNVYPNPGDGKFTLKLSGINGQCSVEVYNVFGQLIYSQFNIPIRTGTGGQNSTSNINISSQPNGVYFYRLVKVSGETVGEGKLVIVK